MIYLLTREQERELRTAIRKDESAKMAGLLVTAQGNIVVIRDAQGEEVVLHNVSKAAVYADTVETIEDIINVRLSALIDDTTGAHATSWVVYGKKDNALVEISDIDKVEQLLLRGAKCVPIGEHLVSLNRKDA